MDVSFFDFVSKASPILAIILMIILAVWFYVRAGTLHFIYARIWNLIGGKRDIQDGFMKRKWESVIDMEFFRFQTGIKFRSREQLVSSFEFVEKNGMTFGELCRISPYYDPETVNIKELNYKRRGLFSFFLVVVSIALFHSALWFSGKDSALLVVKESGTYFWANGKIVEKFRGDGYVLDEGACKEKSGKQSGDEVVMCSTLLGGEEFKKIINETIQYQKVFGLMLSFLFAAWMMVQVRITSRIGLVHKIKKGYFD